MGSTAEGILGKSGSGGPASLGMAPSVWGLVNHPLQRLLESSHSATASEKHPVLPHNHRDSIHRQRMEHSRKMKLQEPAGLCVSSAIIGSGITQKNGEGGVQAERGEGIDDTRVGKGPNYFTSRRKVPVISALVGIWEQSSGGVTLRPERHRSP